MRQRPLCVCFIGLLGIIWLFRTFGFANWWNPNIPDSFLLSLDSGESVQIYGTVVSRAEKTNSISYILSDAYAIDPNQENQNISLHKVQLYFSLTEDEIKIGSKIWVKGNLELYENASNPGGFDAADYYAAEDCYTHMYAEKWGFLKEAEYSPGEFICQVKKKMKSVFENGMSTEGSTALSAMLLGEKSNLEEETKLDYSVAGLSHLLSISGLHIGLIGTVLYRFLLQIKLGLKTSAISCCVLLGLYTGFTGASEATLRAFIMFGVLILAKNLLRSYDPLCALSLAGIIILILRPMSLFRAGFQLSFAAAAAASCVYPLLMKKGAGKEKRNLFFDKLYSGVLLWISINVITFPFILFHFYEFPLYSLISNLVFVPFMSAVLILGGVGALLGMFSKMLSTAFFFLPNLFFQLLSYYANFIEKLPYSMIVTGKPSIIQLIIGGFGLFFFLILIRKRWKKYVYLIPAAMLVFPAVRLPSGFSLTALDVGQGDALVVQSEGGNTFLIDGGSSSEDSPGKYILEPYLKSQGIVEIEGIVISHGDLDHTNAITEVLDRIYEGKSRLKIHHLFMPIWMKGGDEEKEILEKCSRLGITVFYLQKGDMLLAGNLKMKVVSPGKNDELNGNAGSVVLSLEYKGFKALLTGDLEKEGEEKLLGKLGSYDYLKTAHHGSKNSSSERFLMEVDPKVCIISAPKNSIYGHPHKETLERIEAIGSEYYQTGIKGAIKAYLKNGKLQLEFYKEGE